MNESEFIGYLSSGLRGLPDREEIIADIREHIAEARRAGRSEEDIIQALGSANVLAGEYRAQACARESGENPGLLASLRLLGHGFKIKFSGSSGALLAGIAGLFGGAILFALLILAFKGIFGFAMGLRLAENWETESIAVAVADLLRQAGFGLLAITGILALALGLVESGKRSRNYINGRAARK